MAFAIGDAMFLRNGVPGRVIDKNKDSGEVVLTTDKEVLKEQYRHGLINGMDEELREEFNDTMDDIREEEEPKERIADLKEQIEELETDPEQRFMAKYLRSELNHLMNTHRIKPKEYVVPVSRTTE